MSIYHQPQDAAGPQPGGSRCPKAEVKALVSNREDASGAREAPPVRNAPAVESGIPAAGAHRGKRVSEAEFRRMWMDRTLSLNDIAARLNINFKNVSARAKRRGLPKRDEAGVAARLVRIDCPQFPRMWALGVSTADMALHYGVALGTIWYTARRLGLPRRKLNRWHMLSLADFRAIQLREALAARAREEQAAFALAEMVDGKRTGGDGRRAA